MTGSVPFGLMVPSINVLGAYFPDWMFCKHTCGLVDRLARAESELPVLAEQGKRIQLRQGRILAEVGLVRALDGGFRAEVPAAGAGNGQ